MKTARAAFLALVVLLVAFAPAMHAYAEQNPAISKASPHAIIVSGMLLAPSETGQIRPEFEPMDADARVSYTSSNKAVAKVSSDGVVKAIKPGTATITVKAKKGGAKATLRVTVAYRDDGSNYFFYGVGNANYKKKEERLPGCISDVKKLAAAFGKARFAGRPFHTIAMRTDLTRQEMASYLADIATNPVITEKDTTIFYYSGHGGTTGLTGHPDNGALVGVDGLQLSVDDIRKYLDQVPGRVIVILDSCLSGQFIESKGTASLDEQAKAFEQGVINAFASGGATNNAAQAKALTDSEVAGKYKIITACRPLESSYSIGSGSKQYGLFSRHVIAAIGTKRPADTNKDKRVTVHEMYKYASAKVKAQVAYFNKHLPKHSRITQHVMVWPPSDKSFVFATD